MKFTNKSGFEKYIRNLITNNITAQNKNIYLLDSKKLLIL